MIKLIAGLGNPGTQYSRTRHNIGFQAIDRLLEISPAIARRVHQDSQLFETREFGWLCKPLAYMNRSGKAIASVAREIGCLPEEILVLYDDFALDLGMIRVRAHGSAGGHNGLQSIIDHLGSTGIPRVRLGIKTDEMQDWVDFVLSDFRRVELDSVAEMLDLCSDAVAVILNEGIPVAMNRYNRKQKSVE